MAPKVSTRPRSKERDPELPTSRADLINFQKPNLPPLQGTPSSRRQYSYGAGVEPLPARPGRHGLTVDLASAVRGALTRHDEEEPLDDDEDRDDELDQKQKTRQSSHSEGHEEDELAGSEADYKPRRSKKDQGANEKSSRSRKTAGTLLPPLDIRGWTPDGSEFDDVRSFDMEDNYYGDAMIDSSPQTMPPPNSAPLRQKRVGSDNVTSATDSRRSNRRAVPPNEKHAMDKTNATTQRAQDVTKGRPGKKSSLALASPPESDAHLSREGGSRPSKAEQGWLGSRPGSLDGTESQKATYTDDANEDQPLDPRRRRLEISPERPGIGLFSRAMQRANRLSPFSSAPRYRSNDDDMDAAIQKKIQAAEVEAARQHRKREEAEARQEKWRRRWAGLKSSLPWRQPRSMNGEGVQDHDDDAINWWQLFNPLTHLRAIAWFFHSMLDRFASIFVQIFKSPMGRLGGIFLYVIAGILALLMAIALSKAAVTELSIDLTGLVAAPKEHLGGIISRIGDSIPSWPPINPWDDFSDLAKLSEGDVNGRLKKILQDIVLIKKTGKLHHASIKKLEAIVPKLVHMDQKNGKLTVAQEFWHAILDLIRKEGSFLTLEKKGSVYQVSSEKQWKDMAARLARDPAFASQLSSSIGDMEDRLSAKMPHSWDAWVDDNEHKISQMLGSALDKRHLGKNKAGGEVVTREEFLNHLQKEFATYRTDMKAEFSKLEPKLEQSVRESLELANNDVPSGMTRQEIANLVNGLVRKAIADANLEAMARSRIHAHWDQDLKNQVNYFGVGVGAVIDGLRSSYTFIPDQEHLSKIGLKAVDPYDHIVALVPWFDDGDCWCAARDVSKRGNPHSVALAVVLGHTVIPQHIVVEHILPGATIDPGARPRHIEVYARIEDPIVRERVLDFSAAHFPDDEEDWDYTPLAAPRSFVKIGQFIYEGAELHDGVHVHRLSSELIALDAGTEQVIIRAVSNYGAPKHTCFYRVRLFGHRSDAPGTA